MDLSCTLFLFQKIHTRYTDLCSKLYQVADDRVVQWMSSWMCICDKTFWYKLNHLQREMVSILISFWFSLDGQPVAIIKRLPFRSISFTYDSRVRFFFYFCFFFSILVKFGLILAFCSLLLFIWLSYSYEMICNIWVAD